MMRFIFLLFSLLAFLSISTFAISNELHCRYSMSPSESRYQEFVSSADMLCQTTLCNTPAFYSLQRVLHADTAKTQTIVSVSGSAGSVTGDFLPYEGNGSYDWDLYGFGKSDFEELGVLYGSVQYARGKHSGISWSAMRYPELYMPYAISDSTGGDSQYERYRILGGYAFSSGRWHFGVKAEFEGDQSYRLTDPRLFTNTTFLSFGLSCARHLANNASLLFNVSYLRNKQYLHNRYWRPGEQQRFFVMYGFGLYDMHESVVSSGVSRMFYINAVNFDFTYITARSQSLRLLMNVGYDVKYMRSEESDVLDLYESVSQTIVPRVCIDYDISSIFMLQFCSDNSFLMKKGYENLFEKYMTDVATSTYNFRKISQKSYYRYSLLKSNNVFSAIVKADRYRIFELQSGLSIFRRAERNVKYSFDVVNTNLMPKVRVGYKGTMFGIRNKVSCGVQYGRQISVKHSYDVNIITDRIEHLDFQTTFAPYAYYSSSCNLVSFDLSYSRKLSYCSLGVKMSAFLTSGKRLSDVSYQGDVGFDSKCSMISRYPDVHDEKWGDITLFVRF